MGVKKNLRTIRFSPEEGALVDAYLKKNPVFESFSALARVAILSFIGQPGTIHLNAIKMEEGAKRPSFLWDYDMTERQVREILGTPGLSPQKRWLIERILREARAEEAMTYLDVDEITRALPSLRLPKKIRDRWDYALKRWSHHG